MFGECSEADVTDGDANVILPVTSMDRIMLEQAENIGNCLSLSELLSHCRIIVNIG